MGLSDEQKLWLEARYEVWGVDEVRKELERPERAEFALPDATEFAESWLEAKAASIRRKRYVVEILLAVIAVQIGVAIALFLLG